MRRGLLEFIEADAVSEWIDDVHRAGAVELVLHAGTKVLVTLAAHLAMKLINSKHFDVNMHSR